MKRYAKIILGVATIWPILHLCLLFITLIFLALKAVILGNELSTAAKEPGIWLSSLFALGSLTLPWWAAMSIIYIVNVYTNDRVDKQSKLLWAVILFVGNMLAMPIYWYLYIWRELPPETKTIHQWPGMELKWTSRPRPTRLQKVRQFFFPKVTVFLASTFADLQVERVAVACELLWSDLDVIKMEYDSEKRDDPQYAKTWIDKHLEKSYVVLVLLGRERGSFSPLLIPYTQLEMIQAVNLKKRILIYNLHKPFPDGPELEAHYRPSETMELFSIPEYIPDKERMPYLLGPAQAEINKGKYPRYEFLSETLQSTLFRLSPPKEAPPARDVYSAGELLERIKKDIAPLASGVRTARIIAYIILLWMLSIIFVPFLKLLFR